MKSYALFQEYIWLVETIHKAGRLTLEEINQRWLRTEMSEGIGMLSWTCLGVFCWTRIGGVLQFRLGCRSVVLQFACVIFGRVLHFSAKNKLSLSCNIVSP